MSRFFDTLAPDHIRSLPVYQPGMPVEEIERTLGIQGAIKLASNENPMGPSPRAVEAAREALARIHWYPDADAFALRRALAERLGVAPDELVFGAGSNEIIHMLVHALCRPGVDEVLTHEHAFISYRLACLARDVPFVEAEVRGEALDCDVDALIAAMSPRTKIVFLANPNNPTGAHVGTADFERILEALPEQALLVVDEAYHEYAVAAADAGEVDYPRSQSYRSAVMPRVLTLRTFSKIYGLSGLRVGYAVGDRRVIDFLERVRRPFNVNSVAQAAALAALDDDDHLRASREAARLGLASLAVLGRALGVRVFPSLGNFALVDVGSDAAEVHGALLQKGVIVRPLGLWGLPGHVRISVGKPADSERIAAALTEVLGPSRS
jgi:histidinol-phosphate aminotransferase